MTMKKLAVACMSALLATALVGCGSDGDDPTDAGTPDTGTVGGQDRVPPPPPPPPSCDPPCPSGKRCDTSTGVPECVHICRAPNGCQPDTEVCNEVTGQCEPISCNGTVCKQGQDCVDLATGNRNTPNAVCTCVSYKISGGQEVANSDTCAPYGLVCGTESGGPLDGEDWTISECKKPGAKQDCNPTIGCDGDLECVSLNLSSGQVNWCLEKCTTTADCSNPIDECATNIGHCYYNFCEADPPAQGQPKDRTPYFKPCNSAGTGDGMCVPLNGGSDSVGVCFQTGTAPEGGECDPDAERGDDPNNIGLCGQNELCFGVVPDDQDPTKTKGLCRPLCNAAPAGTASPAAGCATGECFSISGSFTHPNTILGACYDTCDLLGDPATNDCPADGLGNPQGCFLGGDFANVNRGRCTPYHPQAGMTSGADCFDVPDGDFRQSCGNRLVCLNNGKCAEFCDTKATNCGNGQACPECPNNGQCQAAVTGSASFNTGICPN